MDFWLELTLLAVAGLVSGALNVIAGGGSFLILPILLFFGLPASLANGTQAFSQALDAVADTLGNQYRLTYVLPDGIKPHSRLQVTTTRSDVKIVAPTRIPDK